jgi:hypothetical protein
MEGVWQAKVAGLRGLFPIHAARYSKAVENRHCGFIAVPEARGPAVGWDLFVQGWTSKAEEASGAGYRVECGVQDRQRGNLRTMETG